MLHFRGCHQTSVLGGVTPGIRGKPDLKKTASLVTIIHFGVDDASTCRHVLHATRREALAVAHAVGVGEGSINDIRENLGIGMGMGAKAGTRLHEVIVEDTKSAEVLLGAFSIPIGE